MKITKIETIFYESGAADNWLFVKVSTDEGIVGYGEASNEGNRERQTPAFGDGIGRVFQRLKSLCPFVAIAG